jgi:hypothetical protein
MQMRRLTRLTNASQKLHKLKAACALYFAYYNVCRDHHSLRVSPAVEAGITDRIWTRREFAFNTSLGADMHTFAVLLAIFAGIFLPLMLIFGGKQSSENQDRARERRLAEHMMNARLLRLNV